MRSQICNLKSPRVANPQHRGASAPACRTAATSCGSQSGVSSDRSDCSQRLSDSDCFRSLAIGVLGDSADGDVRSRGHPLEDLDLATMELTVTTELQFQSSQLKLVEGRPESVPLIAADASLLELVQVFAQFDSQHVVVRNANGWLVGIVSATDLQNAMRSSSDESTTTWHARTVGSLLHVTLGAPTATELPSSVSSKSPEHEFISVTVGEELVALLTKSDVLLSWNRLEPTLTRASRDEITQLPNRAHFERRFQEEWQRAARLGLSLGVILIDVDHFKAINDRHGHLFGDTVLASVAECCHRQLRSYDIVARFAGDEFVALTCGCRADDIDLPIHRLQEATRELDLRFNNVSVSTSLSIGAAVVSSGLDELMPKQLIEAADQCLYFSKRQGRDRAFRVELQSDGSHSAPTRVDSMCCAGSV